MLLYDFSDGSLMKFRQYDLPDAAVSHMVSQQASETPERGEISRNSHAHHDGNKRQMRQGEEVAGMRPPSRWALRDSNHRLKVLVREDSSRRIEFDGSDCVDDVDREHGTPSRLILAPRQEVFEQPYHNEHGARVKQRVCFAK